MNISRCPWVKHSSPLSVNYHDNEWGKPCYDSQQLFEKLLLEIMQCGLSWHIVLKKRDYFREVTHNFSPQYIAHIPEKQFQDLLNNPNSIRHQGKICAWINNAQSFLMLETHTSFSNLIWSFTDGKSLINRPKKPNDIPNQTLLSKKISDSLKHHGFTFLGPTTCYAFMQASGIVNDHLVSCHKHPLN